MSTFEAAKKFKAEGNAYFKDKKYEEAIEKYSRAIELNANDVTFFSNRSACHAALSQWQKAADDGRQCVMVDKNFVKGYFRAGLAQQKLGNLEMAQDFVKRGLGIESGNKDLKGMSREIDEELRQVKVKASVNTAQEQMQSGQIYESFRTLESAMRLDPNNPQLNKMMDIVRPKYEAKEKERVAGLNPVEKLKEEGDKYFKASSFEKAIDTYSKAISQTTDQSSDFILKVYSNRAACYKQLSNFEGTISDCTHVLEYKENDVKALVRRAQAYEACEKYKSALQDVRTVLASGYDTVGKANYDLANGMQHRLNRVIAQLKAM
jgi:tetratricopeptide (TPR) repeat protein